MRKTAVAVAASFIVALLGAPTASAEAQEPHKEIRVNGLTSWPETIEVIRELREKWNVPIYEDDCLQGEAYCFTVVHYSEPDGHGGDAGGTTGNGTIRLNDYYDAGHGHRKMVLYHEFGHLLGLWEHTETCDTSMARQIALCGYYVLGYNPTEWHKLMEEWR